jgi:hypothetical protein
MQPAGGHTILPFLQQIGDSWVTPIEKLTIALRPEIAGFISRSADAGEYALASEAIRCRTGIE